MKKNSGDLAWYFLFLNSLAAMGILIFSSNQAYAQVTPDNTLGNESSVVNTRDATSESIEGGAIRGQNLFHSFSEFNVDADRGVYFANPDAVTNIFSRVTGNDVSDILGTLGVDGAADLFLINPNGIIFGEGASLDVQGSFYGTTAESLIFQDGSEFSAVNPQGSLLTISVPLGLQFGNQPGNIINRSFVQNSFGELVGLEVNPGNNLALIGGNLNFEAGEATASGGNITLGGLSEAGIVSINEDGSLSFPEDITKADITLSNAADVDASGTGGGNINVNARNLSLTVGEFGGSVIRTGIRPESTFGETQAGDVSIDVAEKLTLDGSAIFNQVDGVGNSGNITINTGSLEAINGGLINADTVGQGDAGAVDITATGDLSFDGETSGGIPSGATSQVDPGAVGNAGGVTISTANLTLTNGGRVDAGTGGQGNAGVVDIIATGNIKIDGEDSGGFASGVTSGVTSDAVGNAGGVTISTANLTLTNGGRVSASTFGQGNAGAVDITATGDITIDGETSEGSPSGVTSGVTSGAVGNAGGVTISTANLTLTNGGRVDAGTGGQGDAGAVDITATGDLSFDGETSEGSPSGVTSQVNSTGMGNAAGVTISTNNLNLTNGGSVDASTFGQGNAGAVDITAIGDITIDGETSEGSPSGVTSGVNTGAVGNAGGVSISTANLTLTKGGRVGASTLGEGNAGAINVTATGDINADGENSEGFQSGISSGVARGAEGDAGGIIISTNNLILTKGGTVDASTRGEGNAGAVNVTATGDITADGETSQGIFSGIGSQITTDAIGNAGGITVSTNNLNLTNGGGVDASTFGQGNAGEVDITATGDITIDGEDLQGSPSGITSGVAPGAVGDAGGIIISTNNLILTKGGRVDTSTRGEGNAGAINVTATGDINADGEDLQGFQSGISSQVFPDVVGNSGGVIISTDNLNLTNGGGVDASTFGQGNAGTVNITTIRDININGEGSQGFPSGITSGVAPGAVGDAGGVTILTGNLTLTKGGIVGASTFAQGNAGAVNITATGDITIDGEDSDGIPSGVYSEVNRDAVGNAGGITIAIISNLTLTNGGRVNASTSGQGNAGNIKVNAESITLDKNSSIAAFNTPSADISTISSSGNIDLQISDNIVLRNSDITTQASINANGGNINITTDSVIAFDDSDIFAFAADGQGGNINLNTPAYFAENFTLNSLTSDPDSLVNNSRADLNATGAVSGTVTIPDVSFIQNSLNDLPNNSINTDELVANSCVSPVGNRQEGKFVITGTGGLPDRPGNGSISDFATGDVRNIPRNKPGWQRGEPIIEPQGVYRLANGKLVMSRECR